eukprot:2297691-Alexandrium_andersonii.AAC.1
MALGRPFVLTEVETDWCAPEETEMFEPPQGHRLSFNPARANPQELPRGLNHRFYVPTLDPNIDRQREHRVSGPDQLVHGYEFPSPF